MLKKITAFLFCILSLLTVLGQQQGQILIDSLLNVLPKVKTDSVRVKLLNELSYNYAAINADEGIKYGRQALQLASKIHWEKGIARANNVIGVNFTTKSDLTQVLEYDFKSLKIYEELGDKIGMADNLNDIGNVYNNQSNYSKALEYYLKGLKIEQELNNKYAIAVYVNNIAGVYEAQSDSTQALVYYLKALKINEEMGNRFMEASDLQNIAYYYFTQSDYVKALQYGLASIKISTKIGYRSETAAALLTVGTVYKMTAEGRNKELLTKQFHENKVLALQASRTYIDSAITIDKEVGALDNLKSAYLYLSETQALLGNYKSALESYQNFTLIGDSIFNIEKDKKLTQISMNYEFSKKQLADSLSHVEENMANRVKLQRQKGYTYAGFTGLGLIGLSLFFVFRNYRNQRKANVIISKEKDRSENLLLNILPAEVAEELKETGSAKAKNFEQVTVLFTDFKGFSMVSEKLSAEQLVGEINYCFSGFDNIIGQYNIEKIKTIGDSYMCVAGLPVKSPTHAYDAVKAALAIRDFMLAYKNEKEASGGIPFEIRIGINTGAVVAGIVGVKKFAYDIWGDTVNIASRMESSGKTGKVNISEATYELVKGKFNCEYRGELEAKNKGKLKMYFIEPSSS